MIKINSSDMADKINEETFDIESEDLRKLGYQTIDIIVDYIKNIRNSSIIPNKTLNEMQDLFDEQLPQNERDPLCVLNECREKIIKNSISIGNPCFLGWVLPSITPIGALADGLASTINQNVAVSGSSIATAVETQVVNWIKDIIGYDSKAGGILVSGGSVANLTALVVARNNMADFDIKKNGMNIEKKMVLYASRQVHMCIIKAVNILGIGVDNIRWVDVDDKYCLDVNDLEEKILRDIKDGLKPFAVVASAGTVNTGAVDPLRSISEICKKYNIWFHVDAAYGGFAAFSKNNKSILDGLTFADSIALDPHKWMFIPYEAGCVLVKNPSFMIKTFATDADYIHINSNDQICDDIDYSDYGIQLSRGFRALKIWMSLKQYGAKKYGKIIDQNILLAQYMGRLIFESNDFDLFTPVSLSVCCFRYLPKDLKNIRSSTIQKDKINNYCNVLNRAMIKSMRTDGRALLSSTIMDNCFVLRACIINFRTTKNDIENILEFVRELGIKEDEKLRKKYF